MSVITDHVIVCLRTAEFERHQETVFRILSIFKIRINSVYNFRYTTIY